MLAENGRLAEVKQAILNPSEEALWNLMSSCSNTGVLSFKPYIHCDMSLALPQTKDACMHLCKGFRSDALPWTVHLMMPQSVAVP